MVKKALLLLWLISAIISAPCQKPSPPLANAVILIIRHGEKPEEGTGLTTLGQHRADAYVSYFEHYKVGGKPFKVDRIIATKDTKKSYRERLTVEPLAKTLHEDIDLRFKNADVEDLAKDLKSHFYGHQFLICWHHGEIPDLLQAFGADPAKFLPGGVWPKDTFDWVIELHFDASGNLMPAGSKLIHEDLKLAG